MIKYSLFLFGTLCVFYTVFISLFPSISVSQNQNQNNTIKAEKYIYATRRTHPITIVGTSLSARLVMDSLPNCYNLSFGGLSMIDGISIVSKSAQLPKTLFVETNFYNKESSGQFLEPLFTPINYYLKKYVPSLRSDKQPLAIVTNQLILSLKRIKASKSPKLIEDKAGKLQERIFTDLKKEYGKLPDTLKIHQQLEYLKTKLEQLESQGVKIVFFEMPVHPALIKTIRAQYLREIFQKEFPLEKYTYLPSKEWSFQTTDGIHLPYSESLEYTNYLHAMCEQYSQF